MKRSLRAWAVFLVVGGTAFIIGAGSLAALTALGVSPYLAQVPSLTLAVLTTWAGNRRWTFRVEAKPSWQELGRYIAASLIGILINAAVFSALTYAMVATTPAFAAATLAAMGFNFLGYRFWVFERGCGQ